VILRVGKGKTLLVDGPASVRLVSGEASALRARVRPDGPIVVRRGKRLPFEALSVSEAELVLGGSASYVIIDGSSVPSSWNSAADELLSESRCKTVLVVGGVDSGKSSFCAYVANSALEAGRSVVLIDGDLGQSDIGPPGTISLCLIQEPVFDLFMLRPEALVFLGVTSPSRMIDATINAIADLKEEAMERNMGLLIVNTDGWVEGEEATSYKTRLVNKIAPDIVAGIQSGNELEPIARKLKVAGTLNVECPRNIKKRDRETRTLLRESAYRKHLSEARVRVLPLSMVAIGDQKRGPKEGAELRSRVEGLLGKRVLFCDQSLNLVFFVLPREENMGEEETREAEMRLGKPTIGLYEGEEAGILVGLEDEHGRALGIGTIRSMDYEKGVARICTPVTDAVHRVRIGRIMLDKAGHEIGLISENT